MRHILLTASLFMVACQSQSDIIEDDFGPKPVAAIHADTLTLDTLIGLIPGIGDTIGLGISGYIIAQAQRIGASRPLIYKMVFNVFLDWLIGLVPILGDLFDWGWQANNRNARLLRRHFETHLRQDPEPEMIDVTPRDV